MNAGPENLIRELSVLNASDEVQRILVVDDEQQMTRILTRVLEAAGYSVATAGTAEEAHEKLVGDSFVLVLSDIDMPGASGLELLRDVSRTYQDTATVMVTGVDNTDTARRALEMGAYGYIIKPFEANEILITVVNALLRRGLEIENRAHRERLTEMVKERTSELWNALTKLEAAHEEISKSREETIYRLALAAEFRDDETARHIERMSRYAMLIAQMRGEEPERCEFIRVSSAMHDVGKIATPDSILFKPGKLNGEEFEIMKGHAEAGYRILRDSESPLLEMAAVIALTHHEKWDGTGYPKGLKETDIPLEGRMAAIADVFDALTSNRVYRKAYNVGEAVEIMKKGRGSHFDPNLLDLFLEALDQVVRVMEEHRDRP